MVMESDTGDEDDRETDRSALKEAINSRKKKCQDQKAKGKDNVKRPYNSTSDEDSEELHALTGRKWGRKASVMESGTDDEDEGDTDRSALKEASNSRKKNCQDRKATGKDLKELHNRTSRNKCLEVHVPASTETKQRTKSLMLESKTGSNQVQDQKVADEVVITCVKKKEGNARVYDKRQACFFCEKLYAKISRHLERQHSDESEVAKAFAHPRSSKERKKALEKLRLQGNFHHNLRVLESKSGQLIVMRRPGGEEECSQDDFLPCPDCLGFLKRKDLWRHVKVCNFRSTGSHVDDDEGDDMKYQRLQTKSKLLVLPSICPGKSSLFQDVVASMRSDDITLVARNDLVISALGTMMVEKLGTKRSHDISQKMRHLARLLISLRETEDNDSANLSQFLRPSKFDAIVKSVM